MSSNSNEREIARRFGFARSRPPVAGPVIGKPATSLARALGLRAGTNVLLMGAGSSEMKHGLAATGARVMSMLPVGDVECIVYRAENTYSLRRISEMKAKLARAGAMWVLWPRGAGHINEQHVRRAAASAGLVGIHSVNVDAELSGLKLVHSPDTW